MERNTEKNVNQAKENVKDAGQNMKEAASAAKRNMEDHALTGKQKLIVGLGMIASAATGGAIGYAFGTRKRKEETSVEKELE